MIYGTSYKNIAQELVLEKCPNCGNRNTIHIYIFQEYVHVLWIPALPTGKSAVTQCDHCKQVVKEKRLSSWFKIAADDLKTKTRTPLWTYTGVALITSLILLGLINISLNAKKNAKIILDPKRGDVFEVKKAEGHYTLYKVDNVVAEKIFLQENKFETNLESGLNDLQADKKDAYSTDIFILTKAELKKMFDNKLIIDINRE